MNKIRKFDPARSPGYFTIAEGTLRTLRVAPGPAIKPDQTQGRTLAGVDQVARRAFSWLCQMNFQRPDQWQDLRGFAFESLVYRPWKNRKTGDLKPALVECLQAGDVNRTAGTIRKMLALRTANQYLREVANGPRIKRNPETWDPIPSYEVREDFAGTVPDFAGDLVELLDGEEDFRLLSSRGKNRILSYLSGAVLPSFYRDTLKRAIPSGDRLSFCRFLATLDQRSLQDRMEPAGVLRFDREYQQDGYNVQIWRDEEGTEWESHTKPNGFLSEFRIYR